MQSNRKGQQAAPDKPNWQRQEGHGAKEKKRGFQSEDWTLQMLKSNQDRKDSAPRPLVWDLPSTPRITQKPVPSEKARFLMELNPPSALGF